MFEPTKEQMKQALRVAEEALKPISRMVVCIYPNWCDACNDPENVKHEFSWEAKTAQKALTQISPILEKLEEG